MTVFLQMIDSLCISPLPGRLFGSNLKAPLRNPMTQREQNNENTFETGILHTTSRLRCVYITTTTVAEFVRATESEATEPADLMRESGE